MCWADACERLPGSLSEDERDQTYLSRSQL
jgi:hypothetical protein